MAHPIIAAQDALKVILDARSAWDNVDIRDGSPTETEDISASAFWFNDVTNIVVSWASLGNPAGGNRRRVSFLLGFTIAIRVYGDDEHSTRDDALDLFEDLDLAIKANPAFGIPAVIQTTTDVTGTFSSVPVESQIWGAFFTGQIACQSRAY